MIAEKNNRTPSKETAAVLVEIAAIRRKIELLEDSLELQVDEDLIEATIYEIKALNCRYSHYLREAKRLGIQAKIPINSCAENS